MIKALITVISLYICAAPFILLVAMTSVPLNLINHSVDVEEVDNEVVFIFDDIDGEVDTMNYYVNKENFEKSKVVFVYNDNKIRVNPEKYDKAELKLMVEVEQILEKAGKNIKRATDNKYSPVNWLRRWW